MMFKIAILVSLGAIALGGREKCLKIKNLEILRMDKDFVEKAELKFDQTGPLKFNIDYNLTTLKPVLADYEMKGTAKVQGMLLPLKFSRKFGEAKTEDEELMPEIMNCLTAGIIDRNPDLSEGKYMGRDCHVDITKYSKFLPNRAEGSGHIVDGDDNIIIEAKASIETTTTC